MIRLYNTTTMIERSPRPSNPEAAKSIVKGVINDLLRVDGFELSDRTIKIEPERAQEIGVERVTATSDSLTVYFPDTHDSVFRSMGVVNSQDDGMIVMKTGVERDPALDVSQDEQDTAWRALEDILDEGHYGGIMSRDGYWDDRKARGDEGVDQLNRYSLALRLKDAALIEKMREDALKQQELVVTTRLEVSDDHYGADVYEWLQRLRVAEERLTLISAREAEAMAVYAKMAMQQMAETFRFRVEIDEADAWMLRRLVDRALSS